MTDKPKWEPTPQQVNAARDAYEIGWAEKDLRLLNNDAHRRALVAGAGPEVERARAESARLATRVGELEAEVARLRALRVAVLDALSADATQAETIFRVADALRAEHEADMVARTAAGRATTEPGGAGE